LLSPLQWLWCCVLECAGDIMANAIDALDTCSRKLEQAQSAVKKTRTVVTVLAGTVMVGGLGLLLWKLFHDEEPSGEEAAPPKET